MEKIRKDGYIVEREEAVEGIMGIAAPIRDYSRQIVSALGVALPIGQRSKEEEIPRIVDLVKNTADAISSEMGYLKI